VSVSSRLFIVSCIYNIVVRNISYRCLFIKSICFVCKKAKNGQRGASGYWLTDSLLPNGFFSWSRTVSRRKNPLPPRILISFISFITITIIVYKNKRSYKIFVSLADQIQWKYFFSKPFIIITLKKR